MGSVMKELVGNAPRIFGLEPPLELLLLTITYLGETYRRKMTFTFDQTRAWIARCQTPGFSRTLIQELANED